MSNLTATKDTWSCLNTKRDLFKIFNEVDQNVIEMVIESRDNNLLLAYQDLTEIAKSKDTEHRHYPKNEKGNNSAAVDLKKSNFIDLEHLLKKKSPIDKILYLVSNGYKVMVIMRGLPGSGKSYQATNILNMCYTNPNYDKFIYSTDKFFINKYTGRFHYNKSKISIAHQWSQENVKRAVQREVTPVIIDNTNIEVWEMKTYIKLAVINGYWIEILEPTSAWAWEGSECAKKNIHKVPYDSIMKMFGLYEHHITIDNLLTKFQLKYSKKNQPPQLSVNFEKDQLCKNNIDERQRSSFEINDDFKDKKKMSPKLSNNDEKIDQCISFKYRDNDTDTSIIQKNEISVFDEFENFADDTPYSNDDCQSVSSTGEASNYVNKSVNTCEDEFSVLKYLNGIPNEEVDYSNLIIFGKNKDINEGNQDILNTPSGKLDKGTTTIDLIGLIHKPTLDKLRENFPENICLLLSELFDKCNGNIDWISDMLEESECGNISKEKLYSLISFEENNFTESIEVQDNIEKFGQNNEQIKHNLHITSLDSQSNTEAFTENKSLKETVTKKKKRRKKKTDFKENKFETINPNFDNDLRKNIEKKFTFGDSLYSDHVLKIKQSKKSQNLLENNDVIPPIFETVEEDIIPEQNDEEKFVQLAIDTSVLTQLCDYFGDVSSDLSKSALQISVKIPEKLAEQLYYCLIPNVPTGANDQETILHDEILARRLQDEYKTPKLYTGQTTFAEVVRANPNKTKDALNKINAVQYSQESPNFVEIKQNHVNGVQNEPKNNKYYNQEAQAHAHSRRQYNIKANQSFRTNKYSAVTKYYLDKAEESKHNEDLAKINEMLDIIKQNENADKLDMHYLSVHDAILALNIFLDFQISLLKSGKKVRIKNKRLTIITGRGKHSPKGRPCIKPVVLQKVKARKLLYFDQNKEGQLFVFINKNSFPGSIY